MANLVLNSIQTPDGTILTSRHRRDFVAHADSNGLTYFVDGGLDTPRRAIHRQAPFTDLSIYDDDVFSNIRNSFEWGSVGEKSDQVMKWSLLRELKTDHILAILRTQTHLPAYQRKLFQMELNYRSRNDSCHRLHLK